MHVGLALICFYYSWIDMQGITVPYCPLWINLVSYTKKSWIWREQWGIIRYLQCFKNTNPFYVHSYWVSLAFPYKSKFRINVTLSDLHWNTLTYYWYQPAQQTITKRPHTLFYHWHIINARAALWNFLIYLHHKNQKRSCYAVNWTATVRAVFTNGGKHITLS